MKNMAIAIVCIVVFGVIKTNAQDSTNNIKAMLDKKQFTFQPININPSGGKTRQLDPDYLLQLKGDSLIAYLPYFGRAYNAPMNPADAGIDFTSTNFSYVVSAGKKNSYNVTIITKDKTFNTTFNLTVFNNRTAYLQANSTDKQLISYNGSILK